MKLVRGMVDLSPNDLEAILDRNERNAHNSIVATAEDGTLLQIIGVEPGAAIHTAFMPGQLTHRHQWM